MDNTKLNHIYNLLEKLPSEPGIVVQHDKVNPNNEIVRVWSIEFSDQTINMEFIFDDTIERERAFAQFLSDGIALMNYIFGQVIQESSDREAILGAYHSIVSILMRDKKELLEQLSEYELEEDTEVDPNGTVGEKGDSEDAKK